MKTLIASSVLLAIASGAFANPPDIHVGDNRNGQIVVGGVANGGVVKTTVQTAVSTNTASAATSGSTSSSTTTGGTANTVGGSAATTSGNATTTGGTANTTSGAASTTSGHATTTSGAATTTGGNVIGGTVGAQTVTGATVGGNNGGTSTIASGAVQTGAVTTGATTVTTGAVSVTTVDANSLAIAEANAKATIEAARLLSDQKVRNTPNISAAALTSSNDTCMGSASAGASGPGIGISFGSTYIDSGCVLLKQSRELFNVGMRAAAMARMCMDANIKEALELTGYECPTRKAIVVQSNEPTDPYVRRRLGLPAIKE